MIDTFIKQLKVRPVYALSRNEMKKKIISVDLDLSCALHVVGQIVMYYHLTEDVMLLYHDVRNIA